MSFEEQIISADNYPSIFLCYKEAIVLIIFEGGACMRRGANFRIYNS